jgi:hypothetical protein
MPRCSCFAIVALFLTFTMALHAADEPAPYTADDFVTSYWCGPPPAMTTLERYKEIKEANFTVTFPIFGGATTRQIRDSLDFSHQLGMKAVIHDGRIPLSIGGSEEAKKTLDTIIKDYADHPALLAYHITDEPGTGAFSGLGEVNAYLKEHDPAHPGYVNLFPSWAAQLGIFGADTYEQHVRKFIEEVKPAWLSYDHYAMLKDGDRPGFFENLEIMRRLSLEAGIPFWNIVLATQHSAYRTLTEPELRFEAMQTIAFGARGLVWFTYWSPAGIDTTHTWTHAMINPDGSRDPHYDMVKAINADVLAIGREIKHAKSIAVSQHGGTNDAIVKVGTSPLQIDSGQVTAGVFRDESGKHFAILASLDYKAATTAAFRLEKAAGVERFDAAQREWSSMNLADDKTLQLDLPAGGGVLVRWGNPDASVR